MSKGGINTNRKSTIKVRRKGRGVRITRTVDESSFSIVVPEDDAMQIADEICGVVLQVRKGESESNEGV